MKIDSLPRVLTNLILLYGWTASFVSVICLGLVLGLTENDANLVRNAIIISVIATVLALVICMVAFSDEIDGIGGARDVVTIALAFATAALALFILISYTDITQRDALTDVLKYVFTAFLTVFALCMVWIITFTTSDWRAGR